MSLANNFRMLSLYNQRINHQLLICCRDLSVADLNKETHSFFSNIINYWNHVLFGDLIMLRRLGNNDIGGFSLAYLDDFPVPTSGRDIYHIEISDVALLRTRVDKVIVKCFLGINDDDCLQMISYKTTEGVAITKSVADFCQHLFNHQTHHRGQLTCILSQLGVDYGCMDLPIIVPEGSGN